MANKIVSSVAYVLYLTMCFVSGWIIPEYWGQFYSVTPLERIAFCLALVWVGFNLSDFLLAIIVYKCQGKKLRDLFD